MVTFPQKRSGANAVRPWCEHVLVLIDSSSAAPDPRPLEAVGDEIATLAGRLTAMLARWLSLVAEFDAREGWLDAGMSSCAEWLAWRCSISPATAREHVRVARRLAELPIIADALSRAELSYSKVRAITRLDHINDEEQVLQLARYATAAQLERMIAVTRRVSRDEAAAAIDDRFVHIEYHDDGTASIRARVPSEDGARLARALEHVERLLTPEPPEDASDDDASRVRPRSPSPARRADALAWMADHALSASPADGETAGAAPEVLVHVDARLLSGDVAAPEPAPNADDGPLPRTRCELDAGAPLAVETARRLCCDAGLVPVVTDGDATLAVGRRTRAIPPSIRRALRARRPTCGFPGCNRTRWLDAHHVHHWADGGRTDLDNLVHLCRHHHRLVHECGWHLRLDDHGECVVLHPGGQRLVEVPPLPSPAPNDPPRADDVRLRRDGLVPLTDELRYDLSLAVEGLLALTRDPEPELALAS